MFEGFKNTINNIAQNITAKLVPPPTKSAFREKGTLTPDEFIAAGDKMVQLNGSWGWYSAVDASHTTQYLPKDKQFLGATNVISRTRCKDLVAGSGVTLQEDSQGEVMLMTKEPVQENELKQSVEQNRYYNLYVIYDLYYFTPRLYINGNDEEGKPLTYEQIKEDIMVEYADKTVTNEFHPHLNTYMATVHPCRHADVLKFLTQQMIDNGAPESSIHADNSIIIFLKFMGSVIPTIQFDFVPDLVIA